MVALYDTVPLGQLLDQLDELEARPREAWSPRAAVQHGEIERTVAERVLTRGSPAGIAFDCKLDVDVRARWRDGRATVTAVELGGALIGLSGIWTAGAQLQLVTDETRIAVSVVEHVGAQVRVAFLRPRTLSAEHRFHAFAREAVRARVRRRDRN